MDVTAQKCYIAPDWGDFIYFKQVEKRDNKNLSGKLFIFTDKKPNHILGKAQNLDYFSKGKYSYTQLLNLKFIL